MHVTDDVFLEAIESVTVGPKAELFCGAFEEFGTHSMVSSVGFCPSLRFPNSEFRLFVSKRLISRSLNT